MTAKTKPALQLNATLLDTVTELRARITAWGAAQFAGDLDVTDLADRLAGFGTPAAKAAADAVGTVAAQVTAQVAGAGDASFGAVAAAAAVRADDILTAAAINGDNPVALRRVHDLEKALAGVETEQAATMDAFRGAINSGDITEVMRLRPTIEVTYPTRLNAARLELLDAQVALHEQATDRAATLAAIADERCDQASNAVAAAQTALDRATEHANSIRATKLATGHTHSAATASHQRAVADRDQMATLIEREKVDLYRRLAGLPDDLDATPALDSVPEPGPFGERPTPPVTPPTGTFRDTHIDRTPYTPTEIASVHDMFALH